MNQNTISRRRFICGLATLTTGALLFAGCGGNSDTPAGDNAAGGNNANTNNGATAKLTGAGATFPYPLYAKWFSDYKSANGVEINYQSIGSGGGISALTNQTVDFGASDAPLNAKEKAAMPAPVVQLPTCAGSVAIVYNLPGVANLKLDGPTLAGIFLGQIKTWNDPKIAALNAGAKLPARPITVAHRSDGSGTTNIFTNYLSAVSPEWKTMAGAGKSVKWPVGQGGSHNDGVAAVVKQSVGGLGYVELAYATKNKISYALVKNKSGQFVAPNVASTKAAASSATAALEKDITTPIVNASGPAAYPIAGYTYLLVYKKPSDATKGAQLVKLLNWAMTEGQKSAESLGYAPLPASVVKLNQTTIQGLG